MKCTIIELLKDIKAYEHKFSKVSTASKEDLLNALLLIAVEESRIENKGHYLINVLNKMTDYLNQGLTVKSKDLWKIQENQKLLEYLKKTKLKK